MAPRLFETPSKKSDVGAIVGGVIGGVAFLGLIALGAILFLRRRKAKNSPPPSSEFAEAKLAPASSTFSTFFSKKKDQNTIENLVAQPYNPQDGSTGDVRVNSWSPNAPAEQAFLSPTGSAFPANGSANANSQSFAKAGQYASHPQPHSPPPTSSSPGFSYERPVSSQYGAVPNPSGQAMWVERP
jgi:hypothetical protein